MLLSCLEFGRFHVMPNTFYLCQGTPLPMSKKLKSTEFSIIDVVNLVLKAIQPTRSGEFYGTQQTRVNRSGDNKSPCLKPFYKLSFPGSLFTMIVVFAKHSHDRIHPFHLGPNPLISSTSIKHSQLTES